MRGSASATGFSPFASSAASRKRSTSVSAHASSFTVGGAVFFGGWNAQNCRPFSMSMARSLAVFDRPLSPRGSGAPIFTHSSKSATTAAGSFCLGGIFSPSSVCRRAVMSRLFSGVPGTTLAPLSPPARSPSRVSSSSPPLSFSALAEWHE